MLYCFRLYSGYNLWLLYFRLLYKYKLTCLPFPVSNGWFIPVRLPYFCFQPNLCWCKPLVLPVTPFDSSQDQSAQSQLKHQSLCLGEMLGPSSRLSCASKVSQGSLEIKAKNLLISLYLTWTPHLRGLYSQNGIKIPRCILVNKPHRPKQLSMRTPVGYISVQFWFWRKHKCWDQS